MGLARLLPYLGSNDCGTVTVTAPAAGAEWTFTLGASSSTLFQALLIAGVFTFTTSATVANRNPGIKIVRQGIELTEFQDPTAIAASAVQKYGVDNSADGWGIINGANQRIIHVPDIVLQGGDVISSFTGGLQATDQYSAITLWVVQW